MTKISSSQLRNNLKTYLDMAEQGEEVFITRGDQLFKIVPLSNETQMTKEEYFAQLEHSLNDIKHGRTYPYDPEKGLEHFLNNFKEQEYNK